MRYFAILLTILATICLFGCRDNPDPPAEPVPPPSPPQKVILTPDPLPILDQMVNAYKKVRTYFDNGTVQIIGKMSDPNAPPKHWNCNVLIEKPNRFRLQIADGTIISDGKTCFARIHSQPKQFLELPVPENLTLEHIFQDVELDHAMSLGLPYSVLRFPPQLILLLADDPLKTFCPGGAKIEWIERQNVGKISCNLIRISHSDGNRLLWISQESGALLRLDYHPVGLPVPEGFESIDAIRIDLSGAKFAPPAEQDSYDFTQMSQAERVSEFPLTTPGLLSPEEHRRRLTLMTESGIYRQIDQQGAIVSLMSPAAPQSSTPKTFSLTPIWTQPLVGGSTIALLPGKIPQLLIPCEGNLVAALDLQGKILQKYTLENVKDSIITDIKVGTLSENRRIGIMTLDSKFFLFDKDFKPLEVPPTLGISQADNNKVLRDFVFVPHEDQELLVIACQRDFPDSPKNEEGHHVVFDCVNTAGTSPWMSEFDGSPNQISPAIIAGEQCVILSYTALARDWLLLQTTLGTDLPETLLIVDRKIEIPNHQHVLWFQTLNSKIYSTIYTLLEDPTMGDIRFTGLSRTGKGLWSRLLPAGEYEVEPIYVSSRESWFVPLPTGEIMVFDLRGNVTDTFALDVIPTGLFSIEINGETMLIVCDGAAVSAWKMK